MRPLVLAVAAFLACGLAGADSPPMPSDAEAKWQREIDEANDAYAKRPTAILKIDDAVYLKPGQTAWLTASTDHTAWSLKPPGGDVPSVAFAADSETAIYSDGKAKVDLLKAGATPYEVSATLRVGGGMAQISPDEMGFRLMVFNDDNPHAAGFTGLEYFPYDPSFVVTARFAPASSWEKKVFQTSRGWYKAFFHIGDAIFSLRGKQIVLPMYAGSDKLPEIDSLAAFVMDDTTGKETYGVGRYIDVPLTLGIIPKEVTLDFNYLYNPNCARSPHYNCPVAVDRLPIAVLAGEKKPSAAH